MPKAATDVFANGGWVANPEPKAEESFLKVSVSADDDKTATVKMPDGAEQQLQRVRRAVVEGEDAAVRGAR